MSARLKEKKNRLLKRFLLSYIIILIIPLLISGVVFRKTANVIKNDALEDNLNMLEQTRYIIDQGLKEMNTLSMNISEDPNFEWLLKKQEPIFQTEIFTLHENLQRLHLLYSLSSNFIMNYYMIYPNSNAVLTPNSNYDLAVFYGSIFKDDKVSYEEWKKDTLSIYHNGDIIPSRQVFIEGNKRSVITYLNSISVNTYMSSPRGTIMILINREEMLKPLAGINTEDGGNVYILDASGQIVASKYNVNEADIPRNIFKESQNGYSERKINGKKMLISYTTSETNGWVFVAVTKSDAVLKKVNDIWALVLVSFMLCVLLGLIAAGFMSYKNAKPIKEIISLIMSRTEVQSVGAVDEYNYLQSTFSKLLDNDAALRDKIRRHIPFARAEFINRLLKGEFISLEEINSNMLQVELNIDSRWFNVLIVHIIGYQGYLSIETLKELNALKLILKNTICHMETELVEAYAADVDETSVAFLMAYRQEDQEACKVSLRRILEDIEGKLNHQYPMKLSVGCGNFYNNMLDIYYSFIEAKNIHENEAAGIIEEVDSNDQLEAMNWIYYYPIDMETRLINLVKAGNKEETVKLLEKIYKENFEINKISIDMADNLFNEMRGTAFKIFNQICKSDRAHIYYISTKLKKLKKRETIKESYATIVEILSYICDVVEGEKQNWNSKLKERILRFLEENYIKQELSLSYIASYFNFSDTNFSYYFKEQIGENFSNYLEKIRMERACNLILKGNMSIEEIAAKIGYNSGSSFRRAFKRFTGTLPSEYKKVDKQI